MRKRKQGGTGRGLPQTTVRLPVELREWAENYAKARGVNIQRFITRLLEIAKNVLEAPKTGSELTQLREIIKEEFRDREETKRIASMLAIDTMRIELEKSFPKPKKSKDEKKSSLLSFIPPNSLDIIKKPRFYLLSCYDRFDVKNVLHLLLFYMLYNSIDVKPRNFSIS